MHKMDSRDVTDLTKDRTIWRNLVQTHRQFTRRKKKKKTEDALSSRTVDFCSVSDLLSMS